MSASTRTRSVVATALSGALLVLLGATAAWAEPAGRIQEVVSGPGIVKLILAAEGLAEGESIDPASVKATISGVDAATEAAPIEDEAVAPVARTAMLVLDSSGSMAEFGKLATAKESAKLYLDSLPAEVSAGLISFADEAVVNVAPTLDRAAVAAAIDQLKAEGSTALNDAVVLAVEELGADGSRNALLLSDGKDEGSETSAKKARATLADSGVVLDAVSLGAGDQEKQLAAFAKAGNGSVVTATDSASLTAAFESAARSVATQLAVSITVPEGIESGTEELTVTAVAGGQAISDSVATIIEAAPAPSASSVDYGPAEVADADPGILRQTWVLIVAIGLVFLALLGITALAVGAIDAKNRKQGRVARRLEEVSMMGPAPSDVGDAKPETVLGESTAVRKAVSFADRVAASRDSSAIARKLEEANVTLRPGEWAVVHALIAVLAGLLATLFTGFNVLWSVVALLLGLILPWLYLGNRATKRKQKFYDELPDAMQMLAGSLSAGYSLPQALDNVAKESTGPLGLELNRALLESRLGLPIEETLESVAQRMKSTDFHWVVMAIRINRRVGGNLSEVLTNVGMTLRERERLRRQVKTLSAEGRLSAYIIGALPFLLLAYMLIARPEYILPLLTQPIGWVIMGAALIAFIIGVIWMRNLVNMEV